STLRARKGGALGALAAVGLAVVLVVSSGILLESSLRKPIPVERLSAADVVVQGKPTIAPERGEASLTVFLSDRRRLPAGLAERVRDVPGVARVVADRTAYAQLLGPDGARTSSGHGWSSAALTPYMLTAGHEPVRSDDVVVDGRLGSFEPGE